MQYLRFPLDAGAQAAMKKPGTPLRLRIDHRNYAHATELGEAGRAELVGDLAERD